MRSPFYSQKVGLVKQSATQHQPNKLIINHVGFRVLNHPTGDCLLVVSPLGLIMAKATTTNKRSPFINLNSP